jgi:hypothetical protein
MTKFNPPPKNPEAGVPLISTICKGCRTPLLEIKFSNLFEPYCYPNSPTIPRYSVTCVFDPKKHKDFIEGIRAIENRENVDSILKPEITKDNENLVTTGRMLVKFQGKEIVPMFTLNAEKEETPFALGKECMSGDRIVVFYNILRFTKRNTSKIEHGITFKPTKLYYYKKDK